jgi:parallel beta-helix repeat protein
MVCACCVASIMAAEDDPLIITQSMQLDPGRTYHRIVIKASNITLDGNGATLLGGTGDPKKFKDDGISSEATTGVTLKNVKVKGFETGLHLKAATGWTVEGCDFSDNFHDPAFGWGENGRRGGILLERVTKSILRKNHANRVWDACTLVSSDDNVLESNDFSHTSDTCLKLWISCRNTIKQNNLSYGLRIAPNETHARDSTCVLIESGSNDNRFIGNDCTHGGDGIFIRVLNQWISTGNVFEENDASFAHNNCVESWSPGSTWLRNKANFGSYGFWLGGADRNVLIGNEASFNGRPDGHHNSPHLPGNGHSGIVYMFGPSSHTIVRGNRCEGNNGAGIAAIGDLDTKGTKWNAFHWIIEQNQLKGNRWGIYLQHADMLDLAGNRFEQNSAANIYVVENVNGLIERADKGTNVAPPKAVLKGPELCKVGERVIYDASTSTDPAFLPLTYRWRIAPNINVTDAAMPVTYPVAGFYRVALTVSNGSFSDLAWRDVYVIENSTEIGTEGAPQGWDWIDPQSKVRFAADEEFKLLGRSSIRANIDPYSGGRVTLRHTLQGEPLPLAGKTMLTFWLKTRNEAVPAWQDVNPLMTLTGADGKQVQLVPVKDFLSQVPYNEARDGWTYFSIPLAGNAQWKRKGSDALTALKSVSFGFDSWGAPPLVIWIDGLSVK